MASCLNFSTGATGINKVTAVAHSNIALVKYWGKAPGPGNLPAVGSISIGLDALCTTTTVSLADGPCDSILFDGDEAGTKTTRIADFLSLVRQLSGKDVRFRVETGNNFPTGAGLASSASGFAALALAVDRGLGLGLSGDALCRLARQGSGSAARSIYGGFVEMAAGEDATAWPLADASSWPLDVVVAITSEAEKATGSTEAMERSRDTSPFYASWVANHAADMDAARDAIGRRDFERLADVSESSCLKMHATIMASRPPVVYWSGATVDAMRRVRALRREGVAAFFTIDAGPQVKAVCEPGHGAAVAAALQEIPGVARTIVSGIGGTPTVTARP